MPVKKRLSKIRALRITPAAVDAFRVGVRTRTRSLACLRDQTCASKSKGRHCPTCEEHYAAHRELHSALGLSPHKASPIDVDDGPAPNDGTAYAESWVQAQELRAELAGARPR